MFNTNNQCHGYRRIHIPLARKASSYPKRLYVRSRRKISSLRNQDESGSTALTRARSRRHPKIFLSASSMPMHQTTNGSPISRSSSAGRDSISFSDHPFGPWLPLPLARLACAGREVSSSAFHVKEGLFTR